MARLGLKDRNGVMSIATQLPATMLVIASFSVFLVVANSAYAGFLEQRARTELEKEASGLLDAVYSSGLLCSGGRPGVLDGWKVVNTTEGAVNRTFHCTHRFYIAVRDVSAYPKAGMYCVEWGERPSGAAFKVVRNAAVVIEVSPEEAHAAVLEVCVWS